MLRARLSTLATLPTRDPPCTRAPRVAITLALAVVALAGAGCGTDAERVPGGAGVDTLVVADTVVATSSELIGGVSDLHVAPDGRVVVADWAYKRVLSVRPDGSDARTIGREGSGPGEFTSPMSVAVTEDTLWAFDARQSRIQAFDRAGNFLRAYDVAAPQLGGGRALNRAGQLAAAVGGLDSALVAVIDAAGGALRSFGLPVAPFTRMWDFGSIKGRIRDGVVPDEFRNSALPVWLDDGSVVVAFHAEPELRRYGPDGTLRWSRRLEDPVMEATRAAFFRANVEEPNPARLHPLRYIADAAAVGDEVWVLLNTAGEDDGRILAFDAESGKPARRFVLAGLPGAGAVAVDGARERLYVAIGDEAMVVALDLPH